MANDITIKDNGPLIVEGEDLVLKDPEGNRFDLSGRNRVALCRCGRSENKPFCDGTHGREGFESRCRAFQP